MEYQWKNKILVDNCVYFVQHELPGINKIYCVHTEIKYRSPNVTSCLIELQCFTTFHIVFFFIKNFVFLLSHSFNSMGVIYSQNSPYSMTFL